MSAESAWKVANAAVTAAFDVSVAEMLAESRQRFPQVQALVGVYIETANGTNHFDFDAVVIKDKRRPADTIKPENAEAIRVLLRTHLDCHGLAWHAQEALDRFVSDDGLLWTDRIEPFASAEAPA